LFGCRGLFPEDAIFPPSKEVRGGGEEVGNRAPAGLSHLGAISAAFSMLPPEIKAGPRSQWRLVFPATHFEGVSQGNFRYSQLGGVQAGDRGRRSEMPQGTVKMFRADKGFGFIAPDEGGSDAYVNVSELEKTGISSLFPGQKVSFDVELDKRSGKPRAVNVHIDQ